MLSNNSSKFFFEDVTLLITHYNRSFSLERLLKTFVGLNCTFEDIVVSDDCSKPEHAEKLKALQEEFGFRLITTTKNGGLGNNINKGNDNVKTSLVLYVQEDFVPKPAFPERLMDGIQFMKEMPELDMVRFYAYFKYPYLKPFKKGFSEMLFKPWYPSYLKFYYYSDHPHLRRTSFFEKFGRFAEGVNVEVGEYRMMMSFLKNKGKGLFYDDYQSLLEPKNTSQEPSTFKRNFLRETPNPVITLIRHLYRHIKFNYDLFFSGKY
jgi:glycosyltransferase involved in cell wall biosynthesis